MDEATLSNLITAAALVAFLVSGWATFWIWRARRSGWTRLAASYSTPRRRDSMPRRWQSVLWLPSGVHYPGLLTVRLTVDGLYLYPIIPCRFGHDPLLVPWDDIEIFAVETYPADRLYDLKFARESSVRLRVGVAMAQFIRRAADNSVYFASDHAVHTVPRVKAAAPMAASVTSIGETHSVV